MFTGMAQLRRRDLEERVDEPPAELAESIDACATGATEDDSAHGDQSEPGENPTTGEAAHRSH